jgi:predicted ATPase
VTKGHAAPEVEHAYTQARALCQQVGETPELVPVLFGLWRFYVARQQLHTAREIGETLLRLGQRAHDSAFAVIAHYALEDGLRALAEAHTLVEQHEDRYWEAEACRLRGVLLLRQLGTPQAEAEAWLQRALDIARRQEAKSLELRAAMSLSRLWHQQGKRQEAHGLLAKVYGWFTEGFDTADLQEAQALLAELS